MRLINTSTLQMKEFEGDASIPPYAILSHTWEKDEYLFCDKLDPRAVRKAGYAKIKRCCEQALQDDHEWLWADTCCIDKSSSAELSEAINSMFRWYRNAQVCYAYLADVAGGIDFERDPTEFRRARWFRRGWTLQELLAPANVVFFSKDWRHLGTSDQLSDLISQITNIHVRTIRTGDLRQACVATKMSWAAYRETTRVEDLAYCLLGIFDVNIPLLYGEGRKAFIRLQEEILRVSADHSLFAWGLQPTIDEISPGRAEVAEHHRRLCTPVRPHDKCGKPHYHTEILEGLLAQSPVDFANCYNITVQHRTWVADESPNPQDWPMHSASINSSGIQLQLPIYSKSPNIECHVQMRLIKMSPVVALLGCRCEGDYGVLALLLVEWTPGLFGRMPHPVLVRRPDYRVVQEVRIRAQDLRPRIAKTLDTAVGGPISTELRQQIAKEMVAKHNFWSTSGKRGHFPSGFHLLQNWRISPQRPFETYRKLGYSCVRADCIPMASHYASHEDGHLEPSSVFGGPQATLTFSAKNKSPFAVIIGQEIDKYKQHYFWSTIVLLKSEGAPKTGQTNAMTEVDLKAALLKGKQFGEDAILLDSGWIMSSCILAAPKDRIPTLYIGAVAPRTE